MTAIADPNLKQSILANKTQHRKVVKRKNGPSLARRVVLTCLAILLVAIPAYVVVEGVLSWNNASEVRGRVLETRPDGPFPDELVVQYQLPDDSKKEVTIPTTYSTAREVGDEVDLIYLPSDPGRAMTRLQSRDDIWKVPPYWMFGSLALATFCLRWAFPEYIRLNSKRRLND